MSSPRTISAVDRIEATGVFVRVDGSKPGAFVLTSVDIEVLPGHVTTPLSEPMFAPEVTHAFKDRIPLGQLGEPDSIAGAYTFLASPGAD